MSFCRTTLPGSITITIPIPTVLTVQPISTLITLITLTSVPTTSTSLSTIISKATSTTAVPDPAATSLISAESATNQRNARQTLIITLVLGSLGIALLVVLVAFILLFWRRRRRDNYSDSDSSPYSLGGRNTRPEAIAFPSPVERRGGMFDFERGDASTSGLAKEESGLGGIQKKMEYKREVELISPGPEAGFEFGSMGRKRTSMRKRDSNSAGVSGLTFMSALGGNPVSNDEERRKKAMGGYVISGASKGVMERRRTIMGDVSSPDDVGLMRASDEIERDAVKREQFRERRGRPGWRDRYGNAGYEDSERMNMGRQRRSGRASKEVRFDSSSTGGKEMGRTPVSSTELKKDNEAKREKMRSGTSTIESEADVDTRASSGIFPTDENVENRSDWTKEGMVVYSIVK